MLAGVFLISLSVMMLELALTRLFSATMYYHFAFLAISLALFGWGASGVVVYLVRRRTGLSNVPRWLAVSSALFALSTVLALIVILRHPLPLGLGTEAYRRLLLVNAASSLPFFFAGCAITLAIASRASEINRLYFFDLVGAAAGCVLLIPVLNQVGAIDTVLLVAAQGAAAGAIFAAERRLRTACIVLSAALLGLLAFNREAHLLELREAKGRADKELLFSKWNSFSRVTVEGRLSDPFLRIVIDADAETTVWRDAGVTALHHSTLDWVSALAYHLKSAGNVLVVGAGGGHDVMAARAAGSRGITAVEINPIIARDVMSREPFQGFSGSLYRQPDVTLVIDEGRSFIRGSRERYDVIQVSMVDTWAATGGGAFALTESYLYTVEAFKDYIAHLEPDGILSLTRWYFEPPDQMLRLVTLARVALDELGIEEPAGRMILVIQRPVTAGAHVAGTFLLKNGRFSEPEVAEVERLARRLGWVVLYTPFTRPDNLFTRMIEARDPSRLWRALPSDVSPTRDNNPFFFNSLRLGSLGRALQAPREWQKTNFGTAVLFVLLVLTGAGVVLFILGPLALGGKGLPDRKRLPAVLYFACVGAGFMIVEIALVQRFILFLGHPVYALSVVLFSLLCFSGIGSALARRIGPGALESALVRLILVLAALILLYVVVLPPIFYGLVHLSRPLRVAITVILLAPLATVMGMPLPTGIRILDRHHPEIIPWAWGVNGAASVAGSVSALVLAILTGFDQALLAGAATYLLAAVFLGRMSPARLSR